MLCEVQLLMMLSKLLISVARKVQIKEFYFTSWDFKRKHTEDLKWANRLWSRWISIEKCERIQKHRLLKTRAFGHARCSISSQQWFNSKESLITSICWLSFTTNKVFGGFIIYQGSQSILRSSESPKVTVCYLKGRNFHGEVFLLNSRK